MRQICSTSVKEMNPKEGGLAPSPCIQFPWGFDPSLIGKEIDIFEIIGGFLIQFRSKSENAVIQNTSKINPELQSGGVYKSAALPAKPLRRHIQ